MDVRELLMTSEECAWWERVRERGALWYLVTKALVFLVVIPAVGWGVLGWTWHAELMLEGWFAGLVCGGVVYMRKETRYRLTLEEQGRALPESSE